MEKILDNELIFRASRSSRPGGQHVNKVSTKIELRFDVKNSFLLTEEEKELLFQKLKNKINSEGELIIVSQYSRSQLKNKKNAIEKFHVLIEEALIPDKVRKIVKPPPEMKRKRLEEKQKRAEKKELRKPPQL